MLKIQNIDSVCSGCCACYNICPNSAITIVERNGGFYYPEVNEEICVTCGLCERTCPAISQENKRETIFFKPYMFKSMDEDIVYNSSSGGLFTALAEWILAKGGIVYGARYNYQTRRLEHSSTDECDLQDLKKSKYIESYIGDTYKNVKTSILADRYVLFVGTPCQVAGLYKYLGRLNSSDKLCTVDFVCHGVPSNRHFSEYVRYEEHRHKSNLIYYDFRPKDNGWKGRVLKLKFANGESRLQPFRNNYFYYAFNRNWMLRESCYNCSVLHKGFSDITIGDFWGIRNIEEYKDEDKGMSMAVTHTPKGELFFSKVAECNFSKALSKEDVVYAYDNRSSDQRYDLKRRKQLLAEVSNKGYMSVVKKHYWKEMSRERLHTFISTKIKSVLRFLGLWKRK